MMDVRKYIAAAVQLCAGSDKAVNLDKAEAFVAEAARHQAQLVVLPEVFLWRGPRAQEHDAAEPIPGPATEHLANLARSLKLHLLAGSILEEWGADGRRQGLQHEPAVRSARRDRRPLPQDAPVRHRSPRPRHYP